MTTQTITQRRTVTATLPRPVPKASAPIPLSPNGRGYPSLYAPSSSSCPSYSWEQIAQHSSVESCWVYSHGSVYDITEWLDRHPGGRDVLLLVAGKDVTDLLPSYHPFSERPQQLLAKYRIGDVACTEFPQYRPDSGFYAECRAEVGRYFRDGRIDPKSATAGLTRLLGIAIVAVLSFALIVGWQGSLPLSVRLLAAVVFGVCQALPLLHCMHDASHFAIGSTPSHWYWIGRLTMDWFAGASITSWYHQHTLGHHVYTNVMGLDPDLPGSASGDIRRVCRQQRWYWPYAFQHVYLCLLYGALAIKFRIQDVTGTLLSGENGIIRVNDLGLTERLGQCASKLFWLSWRFLLPLYYCQLQSVGQFLLCSLLVELVTGYYLTFNFQVSHISPVAAFPDCEKSTSQFSMEWAVSQLITSVDYSHHSSLATFLCGALNYQSVHHLFPCISQYHYPALAPIVERVAQKWGVRYNKLDSFWQAVGLHLQHLREMGVNELHHH